MEKVVEIKGSTITAPTFDAQSNLCFCSMNGEVFLLPHHERAQTPIVLTKGIGPNGICFNNEGVLYVADGADQCIKQLDPENNQLGVVKREYRGKPFTGPNNIVCDSKGRMFFTDSGPLGETSLENPKGSVFCISPDFKQIQALAYECLAFPSSIVLSPQNEDIIYVAETMRNRILRFVHVNGVYHSSVFHQLSGSFGPMGLACDDEGNIYVSMYEFKQLTKEGRILVLTESGSLRKEIIVDNICEMTGLYYKRGSLYISEGSCIYKYDFE
ncbi:hypothetical protein C9374_010324 [Naegleria lovaniensis]|uniref:SMP-30/Gluconolactonase/LRE-like region domain-containing protein n=1 Tax=Naegleria lovaniensis TaxID=51637 RepID=A0AA88GGB3_NAELO|nr:uncharacterized protein C9374_010324 [Naegleria lovaniensis]KAG2374950.1 hypothetical protein C9374_010324 [Naegleria lovaniensis]